MKRHIYIPKGYYIAKNSRTGSVKLFKTFKAMNHWYRRLSIEAMLEWSSWDYR